MHVLVTLPGGGNLSENHRETESAGIQMVSSIRSYGYGMPAHESHDG